jgi:hypothetical protein
MLQHRRPGFSAENQNNAPPNSQQPYNYRAPSRVKQAFMAILYIVIGNALFLILEITLPSDYKPSTLIGRWQGRMESAELQEKLDTEKHRTDELNKVNLDMQQRLEAYKAELERVTRGYQVDLDRVSEAYKASYQLNTVMNEKLMEAQKQFLTMNQQFIQEVYKKNMDAKMTDEASKPLKSYVEALGFLGVDIEIPEYGKAAEASGKEAIAKAEAQTQRTLEQMRGGFDELVGRLPTPDELIRGDRSAPPQPVAPKPEFHRNTSAERPAVVPPAPSAIRPNPGVRLARINNKHPKVLVRSQPKGGEEREKKLCVLTQGAVVAVFDNGGGNRITDPESGITFVHVRFNRQGYGDTRGWIGEKLLDEFSGPSQTAQAMQVCEEITDEEST